MIWNNKYQKLCIVALCSATASAWGTRKLTCEFPAADFLGSWKYVGTYKKRVLVDSVIHRVWPSPIFSVIEIQDRHIPKNHYARDIVKRRSRNSMRNLVYFGRMDHRLVADSLFPICHSYHQDLGYSIVFSGRTNWDMRISRLTKDSLYISTGCFEYNGIEDCLSRNLVFVKILQKHPHANLMR